MIETRKKRTLHVYLIYFENRLFSFLILPINYDLEKVKQVLLGEYDVEAEITSVKENKEPDDDHEVNTYIEFKITYEDQGLIKEDIYRMYHDSEIEAYNSYPSSW
jgi:hypothetical protein